MGVDFYRGVRSTKGYGQPIVMHTSPGTPTPHRGKPLGQLRLPINNDSVGDDYKVRSVVALGFHEVGDKRHHLHSLTQAHLILDVCFLCVCNNDVMTDNNVWVSST